MCWHLVFVLATIFAPITVFKAVQHVPLGSLTHHENDRGRFDRNWWLWAVSPAREIGREEIIAIDNAFGTNLFGAMAWEPEFDGWRTGTMTLKGGVFTEAPQPAPEDRPKDRPH